MSEDLREEIASIAKDLSRHTRWALSKGLREAPLPAAAPAVFAAPVPSAARPAEAPADRATIPAAGAATPAARATTPAPRAATPADLAGAPATTAAPVAAPSAGHGGRIELSMEKGTGSQALFSIRERIGDCTRCPLSRSRRNLVFGTGNPKARLVFVGEGPGAEEDARGIPFVGPAGQLLTNMIAAMGLRREDVYICNVVKCRPESNRNPHPEEVEACEPFLEEQIRAVGPEVIVALGKFAAQTLLRSAAPISRLRGVWADYQGIDLLPTFHPAYLLRSPHEKRKAWADLQLVMARLGLPPPQHRR